MNLSETDSKILDDALNKADCLMPRLIELGAVDQETGFAFARSDHSDPKVAMEKLKLIVEVIEWLLDESDEIHSASLDLDD